MPVVIKAKFYPHRSNFSGKDSWCGFPPLPLFSWFSDKAKEYCTYINSHLSPAISHPGAIPYHAVFDIQHPSKEDETSLTKANPKNRSEKQTSREKN